MIVKERDKNPLSILIALALLIGLIILLIVGLKGNKTTTEETKTTTCVFEGFDDEAEENNTVKIITKNDNLSYLSFERIYTFTEDEVLLRYKYEDESFLVNTLNNLGAQTTLSKNSELGTITAVVNIDYDKITHSNSTSLTEPYSIFVKEKITFAELYNYLTDYGYTCE